MEIAGEGALPSVFAVTDLATASVAAAGREVAGLAALATSRSDRSTSAVRVDARLASYWFLASNRPVGWELPPVWDSVAGDYATNDGWIKLHTNAPHHRAAALGVLGVLGVDADRSAVTTAVRSWSGAELEAAVVAAGGCAAEMRSVQAWRGHPQGRAVAAEPLLSRVDGEPAPTRTWEPTASRPLTGVRVLDLTRVLAGPVATRFLAGYGADVLRLDPFGWDEPSIAPDVTLGKRCARLDLRDPEGRQRFEQLLAGADVLVHGYRSDALDRLGLGAERRREVRPDLVDVALCAYGWTGPWRHRRGFDSLVQMSSGIAHEGMLRTGADRPTPLPAQALDHATGYLLAAAALRGLNDRLRRGTGSRWSLSLARTAELLLAGPRTSPSATEPLAVLGDDDFNPNVESTAWGRQLRLRPPLDVEGAPQHWELPAGLLGTDEATWLP